MEPPVEEAALCFVRRKLDRAKRKGAIVVAQPVAAEGVGRFGTLRDPAGGKIGVIQPASA